MADVSIEKLGKDGDGMGQLDGRLVFVPQALPGETVRLDQTDGSPVIDEILSQSPQRRQPPCPHFDLCGGCTFQHASDELVLDWKRQKVRLAFAEHSIDVAIEPTIAAPKSSRRRVTLTARRSADGDGAIWLGFKQRRSDALLNISTCTILLPALATQLNELRDIAKTLLRGSEEIQLLVTACDNGLDLAVQTPQALNEDMTASFVRAMARDAAFLRGSVNGDVLIEKDRPLVQFGQAQVHLPAGAFLQAVREAEEAMAELVVAHLKNGKRIVDLFCGSGTFSLRLAQHARVQAVELDPSALGALAAATNRDGLKSITTQQRDLHQLPLTVAELKPYDGLCLDPPRAGAELQCREIAESRIKRIAYVSCNPTTLARDVAILQGGGYQLQRVTPIDQFVYSTHVEAVAELVKKPDPKKRPIFR